MIDPNCKDEIEEALLRASQRLANCAVIEFNDSQIRRCEELLVYINTMVELNRAHFVEYEITIVDVENVLEELNGWNVGEFTATSYLALYPIVLQIKVEYIKQQKQLRLKQQNIGK